MSEIDDLLDEILRLAGKLGCLWPQWMRPGLSSIEIDRRGTEGSVTVPVAARAILGWRDGIGSPSQGAAALRQMWAFPRYYPVSLDEAFGFYRVFAPDWLSGGWFPLLFAGGQAFLLVDSSSPGRVVRFDVVEGFEDVSDSLLNFVRTWRDIYAEGAVTADHVGAPTYNHAEIGRIGARNHPGIRFWER